MYYCKELYKLSVLSIYEGELIGEVDKLCFDKNFNNLLEIELIGVDGAKLTLKCKNIYHVGKNAIIIKNNQQVAFKESCENKCDEPIGMKVYSINGEFLGIVKDVVLNEKFVTEKILLENETTLDVKNIASSGKNTMVFNTKETKLNVKNFTPIKINKTKKSKSVQPVSIMPTEAGSGVVAVEDVLATIQNADFLIGRVCTKNIYNFNNELLIKEQTQVTKKVLKEISRFGKLRELMLYTK